MGDVRNAVMDASGYFALNKPALSRNQFGWYIRRSTLQEKGILLWQLRRTSTHAGDRIQQCRSYKCRKVGDFSSFLTGTTANLCGSSGSAAPANLTFDTGQLFDPKSESVYNCPANPQNPGVGQTSVLIGNPIPGNQIGNLDPVAQKVMALYPSPNTPGVVNYTNETSQQQQNDQFDGARRYHHQKGQHRVCSIFAGQFEHPLPRRAPYIQWLSALPGPNMVGGWTRTIGPSAINDVRIGYQRDYLTYACSGCPRPAGTLASFGIAGLTNPLPEFDEYPNIVLNNFALWGDGFPGYYPVTAPDSIEQYEDTFTKSVGRHTFAFGGNLDFWQTKGVTDPSK